MLKRFFDYTPWQVLEIYTSDYKIFCIQVRMNKVTGYKKFRVNKIASLVFTHTHNVTIENINNLTNDAL